MVIKTYNKINKSIFLGNLEIFLPVVYIFTKTYNSWPWKFAAGRNSLTKNLEIHLQLVIPLKSYIYAKNLTCCFYSLWRRLITSNWNNSMNLLLLLISSHMQKTNFITQFILEIRLDHYLSLLWACSDIPKQTHLKQPNNISCFHRPLVISINSTSRLNSFMRYCSLKNPAFWFALTFLDHNSRTTFFPNTLFLQKVKRRLTLSYWSKKEYLNGEHFCENPKNLIFWPFLGLFEPF